MSGFCKETWRKESTPRLRARRVAPGSRSRRDFPRGHPALAENAAHPCAAPCGSDPPAPPLRRGPEGQVQGQEQGQRSEEHTSEIQSLMRIQYAVFCLKKKKITRINTMMKTNT